MKNQALTPYKATRNNERGSALILIFVLVALFGALSYAFSDGTRSGASQLTQEKAQLLVTETLDYTTKIKNAVKMLLIDGCDPTELGFDHPTTSFSPNPNAPSDKSCHIYDSNGGQINLLKRAQDISETYVSNKRSFSYFVNNIENVGTAEPELYLFARPINDVICTEINKALGLTGMNAVEADFSSHTYLGDLSSSGKFTFGDDPAEADIAGKREGCFIDITCPESPTGSCNAYIKVLLEQ